MNQALPAVLKQGERIEDRYAIEHVLGCGGMGVVLAARHVDLDAPRAIKVPHACEDGYEAMAERFRREARIAARLSSEHAVRVCDSGRLESGAPYIVMERLEGGDLAELLRRRGRLPIADAARHVAQACAAVAELHALGFVHLDLKPSNLFLTTRTDGSRCLKVLDFGIARPSWLPGPGNLEGSAGYMAPEQALPSPELGPAADVWALGVILYELLTGRLPFRADTLVATLLLAMTQDPAPPGSRRLDLPPALSDVVMRCLEKIPARRFQNAAELLAALQPFVSDARSSDDDDGDDDLPDERAEDEQRAAATTCRLPAEGAGTLDPTALAEGRLRRTATLAAAWVRRAGQLFAGAPGPIHAVVALGVGAVQRYRRAGAGRVMPRAA
jgi:eukaryotic-like serine/threonine-protein kinase